MRQHDGRVLLSASDLNTFLGCQHASALHFRASILGETLVKTAEDEALTLLQRRGDEHELAHFESLAAGAAGEVVHLQKRDLAPGFRATEDAMRRGVELIFQAVLWDEGAWHGYADFLVRTDAPSNLGPWSYEVHDTKLARSVKAKFAIQLGIYADLLARVQGSLPPAMRVVLGDGSVTSLEARDFVHYVRHAMRRLERAVARGGPDDPGPKTVAEPCQACPECDWRDLCDEEWERSDHLRLIANIRGSQVDRLRAEGITTAAALAEIDPGLLVPGIADEVLHRLRSQAALQVSVRGSPDERRLEMLDPGPGKGLSRLPPPDGADLFFDMEGDPLYSDGGLEYLFGVEGPAGFRAFWARDRHEEKAAFEAFVDYASETMRTSAEARIYHYNHYETTALKRLAMAHGTRESELDAMLREGRFVDLYVVVREAVRTSEPGYSLKNVERFYRPKRDGQIGTAADSIVAFERWLETRDQVILDGIEAYNRDDCVSTRELRDWLVSLRPAGMTWETRPSAAESSQNPERARRRAEQEAEAVALRSRLLDGVVEGERPYRELVADLCDFHRREQKPAWWAMFERMDCDAEELAEDIECLGGLVAAGPSRPEKRSLLRDYRFPEQETKLKDGDQVVDAATMGSMGTIRFFDEVSRTASLGWTASKGPLPDRLSLGPSGPLDVQDQRDAVRRFGESVCAGEARYPALNALLRREVPRLAGRTPGLPLREEGETALEAALRACRDLDGGHLFVQGPPGTGKTWTASRMILDCVRRGLRVGVSALSHKAINNLLAGVEAAAREAKLSLRICKRSNKADPSSWAAGAMIRDAFDDKDVPSDAQVVGATVYYFSKASQDSTLDVMFLDEAGQVSLAGVIATGVAARSLVLVGDQMQLGQPIQGVHPGGSGVSVLEHLLQGAAVVPPEQSVFLDESYRMHPAICEWVSDAIYDGRLSAHPSCTGQALLLSEGAHPALSGTGLRIVPVVHEGRSQRSDEEVAEVVAIWCDLMRHRWRDRHGGEHALTPNDVLVVAPWNVQVNALRRALPEGARVGTVDKFQGQEAPVVLVSMATSKAEHAPRGLGFLFSRERLNVAVSRARCLSLVVACPTLLEASCATIEQLRLVNTLCSLECWENSTDFSL